MSPEDHIPLNPRDYVIMLVLSRGAAHGYGIIKWAETRGSGVTLDPANLYRALRRLDRDGLVSVSRETGVSDGAPKRRAYDLTPLGRRVLKVESARLAQLTDAARALRLIPDPGKGS